MTDSQFVAKKYNHRIKIEWPLVVFLAFIFFLHSHDFFKAEKFEKEGYETWEEVAASIEHGDTQRRVAMLLLWAFGAISLLQMWRKGPNQLRVN